MDKEILLIDKPKNITSFGVVARVRRVLSEKVGKKVKVGHTGTLDPFATGLLILLVGKGTKRSNEFLKLDKWYEATIKLGAISTTGDPEGEISVSKDAKEPILSEVEKVVQSFQGEILQRVPNFSAVKINGERAYKLARKGVEVEMPKRKVEIFSIEILDYKWPELKIRCHVSSGTYIRTLGEDIGEKLGVGGYLTQLRRTKVGEYSVEDAVSLDEFMRENS
ncbi:tRNA pseudouridine(55) synthase TruB [Candidatus Saccharibacteria bacterium]|nr:tRNA pseudouridine(55) synthase TruB [Candidatus Saccharibacteria bacterium]